MSTASVTPSSGPGAWVILVALLRREAGCFESSRSDVMTSSWSAWLHRQLVGADHLEVLVDEDVVRPVDADVVDLVLAVTQLHDPVDDSTRVGRQRSLRRLVGCRSADDRPRPLALTGGYLTCLLGRFGCTPLEGDHGCRRGRLRSGVAGLHEHLCR